MQTPPPSRVVLVTGGSAGLGKELARAFGCDRKTQVVICGRDTARLEESVKELRGEEVQIEGITADVTSAADVERLFAEIKSRFGRLDVLVNNAGKSTRGKVIETSAEDFQSFWEINFLSAVRCAQAA